MPDPGRLVADAVASARGTVAYGRERRLHRVCHSQMLPVVGREVIESKQAFAILLQRLSSLEYFAA